MNLFPFASSLRPVFGHLGSLHFRLGGLLCGFFLLSVASSEGAGTFASTGSLSYSLEGHTGTLLQDGKVLVTGGYGGSLNTYLADSRLFDPATGVWTSTGSLATVRYFHTATLLNNGKVLVAGGAGGQYGTNSLNSCELYDPVTGSWTATGSLTSERSRHTATLLLNGKVLVVGGYSSFDGSIGSSELYDPASGTWSTVGSLDSTRMYHTATLLTSGKVLVVGGHNTVSLTSVELYDPSTGTWSSGGAITGGRCLHTATLLNNGKVLVVGGYDWVANTVTNTSQIYDPTTGAWSASGNLAAARHSHSASLLPNGKILVTGGWNGSVALATSQVYDSSTGAWTTTGSLTAGRFIHTASVLANGMVLVAGGKDSSFNPLSSADLYDPSTGGTWSATGSMSTSRTSHTSTLLPDGKVLVAGGANPGSLSTAVLYDRSAGTWSATGSLPAARHHHTATLLPNGKVLVAGGYNGTNALNTAALYDPAAGTWSATGSMAAGRYLHTATLLLSGKVLVTGGDSGPSYLSAAELYDPSAGTWTSAGSMPATRNLHTATLLPSGKVLVAGGYNGGYLSSAALYDPAAGTWSATGSFTSARQAHTATLLPTGKVLMAGGSNGSALSSSQLYDPATGTWTSTGNLPVASFYHKAIMLPNGNVLVAGGRTVTNGLSNSALYNTATGVWTASGGMAAGRYLPTMTLLPSGEALMVGGYTGSVYLSGSELFDSGLGFNSAWRPVITTAAQSSAGAGFALTGLVFTGISEASGGGGQNSSTNYPVVQLRSLGNEQVQYLLSDPASPWSATSFTSLPVSGLPAGHTMVTVFANGIPSISKTVSLSTAAPTLASVTAGDVNVNPTGATVTGHVTSDGGRTVSARGVVWALTSANSSPQIGGTGVTNTTSAGTTGAFTVSLSLLTPSTSYSFAVYATNDVGTTYTSAWAFTTPCQTITVTNPTGTTGTVGTAFSKTFTQSGGLGLVIFSVTTGPLPAGLSIFSTGVLSGTPTQPGVFPIIVTVADSHNCISSNPYTLVIANNCPTITVTNPTTTTGSTGMAFSQTFVSNITGTAIFSTTSTLPAGLSLSSAGILSGIPTAYGSFPITAKATDSQPCTGTGSTYTLVIANNCPTITVTNPTVAPGAIGTALSRTFLSNVTGTVTFSATGTLPAGLSFSSSGVLSGTPTAGGLFPIGVVATDSTGCSGAGAIYNLVIQAPYTNGTQDLDVDSDGDGVSDAQEAINGTSPLLWDDDHDGIADGLESSSGDGSYQILVFSPGVQFTF